MKHHRPEVADVLQRFGGAFREDFSVSLDQERVLRELPRCRTAVLGGHKLECDRCGHQEISYNSCRNRHCPKCQAAARAKWLAAREDELLDVPYFHVVFTLPEELARIALQDKRTCYSLLFRAAAETLRTIAADPKHLGAQIGFLSVLHTWSQNLRHHPHVHCVVPGGGFAPDGQSWIPCRKGFFLPVRVLSRLFRRLYIQGLELARSEGELGLYGQLEGLRDPAAWASLISTLRKKEWVVYAKPPFGGPRQVLKYLARYTHRVAISNSRILAIADDRVRFRWKDRAGGGHSKSMTLRGVEFVRRFLMHVLPKGFMRIRHYGFLANRARREKLPEAERLIGHLNTEQRAPHQPDESQEARTDGPSCAPDRCSKCKEGCMRVVATVLPGENFNDTS